MTSDFAISLASEAMKTALLVGAPLLGLGLAAGLIISLFQATTQIQEASLQFLPKILAILAGFVLFGPWMLSTMLDFTRQAFLMLPQMVR